MNWGILSVELGVSVWILLMLISDLFVPSKRKGSLWLLALTGVFIAMGLLAAVPSDRLGTSFQGMFTLDRFAIYFKGLFLLTTAIIIVMTRRFSQEQITNPGAFYMLLFTALLGMLVLASMDDLLLLFIGLELLTFSLYVMAAYLRDEVHAVEAGMKYLILGSVSAGFLVYGIALLYGFSGGTSFEGLRSALSAGSLPLSARVGLLLILAALGFKVAMVPFHLWVPDVYEGAPTPVVAFLSVGSKMAGVMAMIRVLDLFIPAADLWMPILGILAALTMLYGNLAAIPQTNIKRMMGYSSIGHAGYLIMGLSTASIAGNQAVTYYLLAYLFSNLAVFMVIVKASEAIGGDALERYDGLAKRSPLLAASLFIGLISLAGIPPLAGFVGKFAVLVATMESGRWWLVAVGALNVVISLYYYLMVVQRMYTRPAISSQPVLVDATTRWVLFFLIAGMLIIGTFQEPFFQQIRLIFG